MGFSSQSITAIASPTVRSWDSELEGLRNPVDLWLAAGGKFHHRRRRKISSPAEVLPLWRAGIQAVVVSPVARDAFWFGLNHGHAPQRGAGAAPNDVTEGYAADWTIGQLREPAQRTSRLRTSPPLDPPNIERRGWFG